MGAPPEESFHGINVVILLALYIHVSYGSSVLISAELQNENNGHRPYVVLGLTRDASAI
jgi:hypothetical protein